MQKSYFYLSSNVKNFLLKGVDIQGTADTPNSEGHSKLGGGIFATCAVTCCIVLLLEAMKAMMFYVQSRLRQNPLTYGQTDTSINQDRSTLFSALKIPASLEQIKRKRIRFHVIGCVLHVINMLLAYIIMLAVMSYDVNILIAVLIGGGGGYFIFGAITTAHRDKFMSINSGLQSYARQDSRATLVTTD